MSNQKELVLENIFLMEKYSFDIKPHFPFEYFVILCSIL